MLRASTFTSRQRLGAADVRKIACEAAFGGTLVTNIFRGLLAEALVSACLGDSWTWRSEDWAPWDFDRLDGVRLEVKQSAALQTWNRDSGKLSACRFDIKPRKGCFFGTDWHDHPGRHADIYIFAHHEVSDDSADHADPKQWRFFVVPERLLPMCETISLKQVRKLASGVARPELLGSADECAVAEFQQGLLPRVGRLGVRADFGSSQPAI